VTKITIFVVHYRREHGPVIDDARAALFGDHKPADTLVGVEALSKPDFPIDSQDSGLAAGGRSCGYQPELECLAEVVADRPVLDDLAIRQPPDVDLLGGVVLAGRRPAEELAHVPAVHDQPGDELVALADLILDLRPHRPPEPTQPADGFLEAGRALGVARGRFVVDKVGVDQVVGRFQVALLEKLLQQPPGICLFSSDIAIVSLGGWFGRSAARP
jgi:hypothetical protein